MFFHIRFRFLSVFFVFVVTVPSAARAWSSAGHRQLTEYSLKDVDYGLDDPVLVTPLASFLNKLSTDIQTLPLAQKKAWGIDEKSLTEAAGFISFLKLNPQSNLEHLSPLEKLGGRVKPRDILIQHSVDPDDGRDQGLSVHGYQKYFGGTTGPSSQAFRHMEKPALTPFNITSTLGLPLGKAGEATQRAQLYFNLARLAREYGEDYWSWRFLACASHYLQDLAQPHHTTEISSRGRLWDRARALKRAGKGTFSDLMSRLVTNSHDWFETYASSLMEHAKSTADGGRSEVKALIQALRGSSVDNKQGSIRKYAVMIRNFSNERAPDLLEALFFISDERIGGAYVYDQEAKIPPDPREFVNPMQDERFRKHEKTFFKITEDCYRLSGESLRTAVDELLVVREPRTNHKLIEEIVELR